MEHRSTRKRVFFRNKYRQRRMFGLWPVRTASYGWSQPCGFIVGGIPVLVAALSQRKNGRVAYSPLVLEFFDGFVVDADYFVKFNALCADRNCCLVLSFLGWIVLCRGAGPLRCAGMAPECR